MATNSRHRRSRRSSASATAVHRPSQSTRHGLALAGPVADALGQEKQQFDIRSNSAGPAVSGEVTLHSDERYVQLSCNGTGSDVMYRRCRDRHDFKGQRNHYAAMRELTNPGALAQRICQDLGLAVPHFDDRLVA